MIYLIQYPLRHEVQVKLLNKNNFFNWPLRQLGVYSLPNPMAVIRKLIGTNKI